MKLITQTEVDGQRRELGPCRCVKVQALSGTATIAFDGGDPIYVEDGDTYELPNGLLFSSVNVFAANGSSVTVLHGFASFGSGGSGGSGLSGTGSPEGVETASPGASYLDTSAASLWMKQTGTGNTGWVQLIA